MLLAKRVVFLPRFLGAFPKARSPLGARARSGASPTFVPHSSTKRSLLGPRSFTRSRQRDRASWSRSEAATVFLVGPPEAADRSARRGHRDPHAAAFALPQLAVL